MHLHIRNLAALDLSHATAKGWVNRVESLLASGVDPNALFHGEEPTIAAQADNAALDENATQPPQVYSEPTEMPALRRAVRDSDPDIPKRADLSRTARLMKTLLEHGADPYALFRQPIFCCELRPMFPGAAQDPEYVEDDSDLRAMTYARRGIFEKILKSEYERLGLLGVNQESGLSHYYTFSDGWESTIDYEPQFPRTYAVCSVLHSLLEDGGFSQPILDFLGNSLDVERRDPQGRTLFLAACRSMLGLDAAVDGAYINLLSSQILPNPYPQPRNPWQDVPHKFTSTCTGPSLLEFFVSCGANLLAVDKYGQNALHNMLAFIDRDYCYTVPVIDHSLKYLVQKHPALLDQPDRAGVFPIHYAIRRMCDYSFDGQPETMFHFEKAVYELLAANTDPLVRDSRGNTVLHYLAAGRLGEGDRVGDEQRRLLAVLLQRGVDPRVRNINGVTALELFFMTGDEPRFEIDRDYDRFYSIGQGIVDAFEQSSYILAETNAANQTLLHLVAKLDSDRSRPWYDLLQSKGLDPEAKDSNGVTPQESVKLNSWMRQ
ncbi:uncharacterized protein N7482_007993 [Penicillium canariense]|uniref:Uncharacterized protein n=1 Tax=Penicillium canariense TaxID=189055 RepID=A0A9W9HSA1_9EURO|nr:uncharacterized protein N7482_007993 [Penicillium canariense]KAJ5156893.1 hypothetical protein N7482_007993 [Penicillium canariense]